MATHSSLLAWRIPWTEEPGGYSPWGGKELDITEWLTHTHIRTNRKSKYISGNYKTTYVYLARWFHQQGTQSQQP